MKVHQDLKHEYRAMREEIVKLATQAELEKGQLSVYERTIFKSLPQVCAICGDTKGLTLDHIVPQSLLRDLGVDVLREYVEDNYQVLCHYCNSKKGGKLDVRIPRTKELLLKVIEKYINGR